MTRRMTVVFDDEELYTALKVDAARTHRPAKDIVADALAIYFEATQDECEALLQRSREQGGARRARPAVERVLQELGLDR